MQKHSFDRMQHINIGRSNSSTAFVLIIIGFLLDNCYILFEMLLTAQSDTINTYSFVPRWILPDILGILVEWLVLYILLKHALYHRWLLLESTKQIITFGCLLYGIRITLGRLIFMISYYGLMPLLFGEGRLFGSINEFTSTILINTFLIISTLISFKIAKFLYRLIPSQNTSFKSNETNLINDKGKIFMYTILSSISAISLTIILSITSGSRIHIQTGIGSLLGTQLAINVFLACFFFLPFVFATLIFRTYRGTLNNGYILPTGVAIGGLSVFVSYLLINTQLLESIGAFGLPVFGIVLCMLYQLSFIAGTFLARLISNKLT